MITLGNTALGRLCRFGITSVLIHAVFVVAAHAADVSHPLTVTDFSGAVKLKVEDRWQDPQVGMIVPLPATVSTGADGSIDLLQDGTTISIAADTALDLLPGPTPGSLVKRVVQSRGSAFYDVSKREQDKLRVETPYLVAVIKGTQFNVTVAAESTSIALFEGRLQIDAPDIGDTVDLEAGHIARRGKGEAQITVLSMEDGEPLARTGRGAAVDGDGADNGATPPAADDEDADGVDLTAGNELPVGGGDPEPALPVSGAGAGIPVAGQDDGPRGADSGLETVMGASPGASAGMGEVSDPVIDIANALELGSGGLELDAAAGIETGVLDLSIDAGAALDVGDGAVDLDIGAGLDVADLGVDVGVGADVDLDSGDLGLDLDAGLDVADLGVDAGVGADVDLGSGEFGLDVDAGADVADVGVDAGLGADVDLGGGDIGLDLDAGADVADVGVDADLGVDVDLGGDGLGVDVDAGLDVADIGVDAGLGADVDLGDGDIGIDAGVGDVGLGVGLDTGGEDAGLDVDLDLDDLDDVTDLVDDLLGGDDDPAAEEEEEDEDSAPLLPDLGDLLGL